MGIGGIAAFEGIAAVSISCPRVGFLAGGLGRVPAPKDTASCRSEPL